MQNFGLETMGLALGADSVSEFCGDDDDDDERQVS
jgi:hypothetical protein